MAKGGKKKQTISLAQFLGGPGSAADEGAPSQSSVAAAVPAAAPISVWADDDFELPSAPAAASGDISTAVGGAAGAGGSRPGRATVIPTEWPTEGPYEMHVGNLSYEITEGDLQSFFEPLAVKSIRVVMDKMRNRPKGFAKVTFADLAALKGAFDKAGGQIQGRTVVMSLSESRGDHIDDVTDWRGASKSKSAFGAGDGDDKPADPFAGSDWRAGAAKHAHDRDAADQERRAAREQKQRFELPEGEWRRSGPVEDRSKPHEQHEEGADIPQGDWRRSGPVEEREERPHREERSKFLQADIPEGEWRRSGPVEERSHGKEKPQREAADIPEGDWRREPRESNEKPQRGGRRGSKLNDETAAAATAATAAAAEVPEGAWRKPEPAAAAATTEAAAAADATAEPAATSPTKSKAGFASNIEVPESDWRRSAKPAEERGDRRFPRRVVSSPSDESSSVAAEGSEGQPRRERRERRDFSEGTWRRGPRRDADSAASSSTAAAATTATATATGGEEPKSPTSPSAAGAAAGGDNSWRSGPRAFDRPPSKGSRRFDSNAAPSASKEGTTSTETGPWRKSTSNSGTRTSKPAPKAPVRDQDGWVSTSQPKTGAQGGKGLKDDEPVQAAVNPFNLMSANDE
ncbi:hypothetical protein GQ42DRAFT_177503 [Ramicandelaber brevisporus]|nr:hypothetical protein GQ42DRAFT_177503 [Ramicandelaber brevisporus]